MAKKADRRQMQKSPSVELRLYLEARVMKTRTRMIGLKQILRQEAALRVRAPATSNTSASCHCGVLEWAG